MVVAAAGPVSTRPGQGLGAESDAETPLLEPVLNYRVDCDADPHTLLKALQTLEGEDRSCTLTGGMIWARYTSS